MANLHRLRIFLHAACKRRALVLQALVLLVTICYLAFHSHRQSATNASPSEILKTICGCDSKFRESASFGKDVQQPTLCVNLTCKADLLRHLQDAGGQLHPIPTIRHLIWRNESVSEYFAKQLRTWQQVHPDWTVVLWRDEDLMPFVAKHFPGALARFRELESSRIMQVDMIRYMLMYKFGGVYADLDYTLTSSLDEHRRLYAVVTREPEAHSLQLFGFQWPPRLMANPAFLMSAPGHAFFRHCIERLQSMPYNKTDFLSFAGPIGLTHLIEGYSSSFPLATNPLETVYVPPSHSFYPYEQNRLNNSKTAHQPHRFLILNRLCEKFSDSDKAAQWPQLQQYCKDLDNMDSITDKSQPVVAMHDVLKRGGFYDGYVTEYYSDLTNVRHVVAQIQTGRDWI